MALESLHVPAIPSSVVRRPRCHPQTLWNRREAKIDSAFCLVTTMRTNLPPPSPEAPCRREEI
jgi:hypothetical protein